MIYFTNLSKTKSQDVVFRVKTQQIIIDQVAPNQDEAVKENNLMNFNQSGDTDHNLGSGQTLPLRRWTVEVVMLDEQGNEVDANILTSVKFQLHPTFPEPIKHIRKPPFVIDEEGWGEFQIKISCKMIGKAGKFTILHELDFEDNAYAIDYQIAIPTNNQIIHEQLEKHYKLTEIEEENDIEYKFPAWWVPTISKLQQETTNDIFQRVISHPTVQAEINRHERSEKVYLTFSQLPDELLDELVEVASRERRRQSSQKNL